MKPDDVREQLMQEGLSREQMLDDPFAQFTQWYALVHEIPLPEPSAMCLATVDAEGQPWQRMVLLKTFDTEGFVFFTNYSSRKAMHIQGNARVSLLFPWYALGRQVKVTGTASKISAAQSLAYFLTRPRGSQIGAWASPQSQVISGRALLDIKVNELKQRFAAGEVPLPSFWGGYRIVPQTFEFWQARENRLHDCFFYQRCRQAAWQVDRLAP